VPFQHGVVEECATIHKLSDFSLSYIMWVYLGRRPFSRYATFRPNPCHRRNCLRDRNLQ
jgi:hypothetical protein